MSNRGLVFLAIAVAIACVLPAYPAGQAPAAEPKLLQQGDLVYEGAFRVPAGTFGTTHGFTYAGNGGMGPYGLAFNPARPSLFLGGHPYEDRIGEIGIPELSNATSIDGLKTASVLQNIADITEGHLANILRGGAVYEPGDVVVGGLMLYKDRLIGTSYGFYDAAGRAELSHFTSGTNLSAAGDFKGMYRVGSRVGFVSGYMAPIPAEWQPRLGGPAFTGFCCASIISRTSLGPALSVFNPDDLGVKEPVPATEVLGYPVDRPGLGTWERGNTTDHRIYNMGTEVRGVVFPSGSRSVLFFGTTCARGSYKPGGVDCSGPLTYVWAYDANDLLSVKNRRKRPWDVRPYATWALNQRFAPGNPVQGVAYDEANSRLYVSVAMADGVLPIVHAYKVSTGPGARP